MQEILEMQPKEVSRERLIRRRSILQIQRLGILCPNVPCLCRSAMPVLQPLPAVPMTPRPPQCMQVMRDWSKRFGVALRQRSVLQETG